MKGKLIASSYFNLSGRINNHRMSIMSKSRDLRAGSDMFVITARQRTPGMFMDGDRDKAEEPEKENVSAYKEKNK